MDEKSKIIKLLYILIVLVLFLGVFNIVILAKVSKLENINTSNSEEVDTALATLTPEQILEKFKAGEEIVLYIGQDNCSYCKEMLPTIYKAQTKYKFTTVYLNVGATKSGDAYNELMALLDVEITANVSGTSYTQAFGKYSVTPMIAVIRNGKMINGIIGAYEFEEYESFLLGAGISK